MSTPLIFLALGTTFLVVSTLIRNNLSKMIKTGVEADGVIFGLAANTDPNDLQPVPIIRFLTTDNFSRHTTALLIDSSASAIF